MSLAHTHHGTAAPGLFALCAAAGAVTAAWGYLLAAARLRRRQDAWPWPRDACFTAGCAALAWTALGVLPGGVFSSHMAQHVLLGMAAPFLLVLARPLTLTLRALPPGAARRTLVAIAHSSPVSALVFPPLAALLDVGGLWLLYRTELFSVTQTHPWTAALMHVHVLATGLLLSSAICQLEPVRRRWSVTVRGAALLGAGAAHGVLAKLLYAASPPGTDFSAADLHAGAEIMYYGGDLLEAALATVLAASWYRTRGRVHGRSPARAAAHTLRTSITHHP